MVTWFGVSPFPRAVPLSPNDDDDSIHTSNSFTARKLTSQQGACVMNG